MKRKLILIPLLVVVLIMSTGMSALAWDVEDTLVADNEDFVAGGGFDNGSGEFHAGEQDFWQGGPTDPRPPDGYNLYRDDVSGTGNLDSVFITTTTPDEIDLPVQALYPGREDYWIMSDASPDAYYWATEPRGIDYVTKADFLEGSGIPGEGLDAAPGLQKPFNPNSQASINAGRK